jgi:hypothetical protein
VTEDKMKENWDELIRQQERSGLLATGTPYFSKAGEVVDITG